MVRHMEIGVVLPESCQPDVPKSRYFTGSDGVPTAGGDVTKIQQAATLLKFK